MSDVNKIKEIELPSPSSLSQSSNEEQIYSETPAESQHDHKSIEALKLVQEKAREENNKLKIENQNLQNLASHRIVYSWWIFAFVVLVVIIILGIFIASGLGTLTISSDNLDTLLQSNTVQVIGILYIIAKWLYPQKQY